MFNLATLTLRESYHMAVVEAALEAAASSTIK